jgi:hypothetical protein
MVEIDINNNNCRANDSTRRTQLGRGMELSRAQRMNNKEPASFVLALNIHERRDGRRDEKMKISVFCKSFDNSKQQMKDIA